MLTKRSANCNEENRKVGYFIIGHFLLSMISNIIKGSFNSALRASS